MNSSRARVLRAPLVGVIAATVAANGLLTAGWSHAANSYDMFADGKGTATVKSITPIGASAPVNDSDNPIKTRWLTATTTIEGKLTEVDKLAAGDSVKMCWTNDDVNMQMIAFRSVDKNLPADNPKFEVTVAPGNCLSLTRTAAEAAGDFDFVLNAITGISPVKQNIAQTEGLSTFKLGDSTYPVKLTTNPLETGPGVDKGYASEGINQNSNQVDYIFINGVAWGQALRDEAVTADPTVDIVMVSKIVPEAGTTITNVTSPGGLTQYAYQPTDDGQFLIGVGSTVQRRTRNPALTRSTVALQPNPGMAEAKQLAPGTYGIVQNPDGSWSVAFNLGPAIGNEVYDPQETEVSDDPTTDEMFNKARALQLLHMITYTPFQIQYADPTRKDKAKVFTQTSVLSTEHVRNISDEPVENKGAGQAAVVLHHVDLAGRDLAPIEVNYGWPKNSPQPGTGTVTAPVAVQPTAIDGYTLVAENQRAADAIGKDSDSVLTAASEVSYPEQADGRKDVYFVYERGYSVSYDLNGAAGTAPAALQDVKWDQEITAAAAPSREFYEFTGWQSGQTKLGAGEKFIYQNIAESSIADGVNLVAQWTKTDDDEDGVPNDSDKCVETPAGVQVGADGCPVAPSVDPAKLTPVETVVDEPVEVTIPVDNPGQLRVTECSASGLPDGLIIAWDQTAGQCVISGTPTSPSTDPVQVQISYENPDGSIGTLEIELPLTVRPKPTQNTETPGSEDPSETSESSTSDEPTAQAPTLAPEPGSDAQPKTSGQPPKETVSDKGDGDKLKSADKGVSDKQKSADKGAAKKSPRELPKTGSEAAAGLTAIAMLLIVTAGSAAGYVRRQRR